MRLKKGFITQEVDGEQIMVATSDTVFCGLVRSNETAAFIVDCLKKETSQEEIANAMLDRYDASRDVIEKSVEDVLNKLRRIDAIDE